MGDKVVGDKSLWWGRSCVLVPAHIRSLSLTMCDVYSCISAACHSLASFWAPSVALTQGEMPRYDNLLAEESHRSYILPFQIQLGSSADPSLFASWQGVVSEVSSPSRTSSPVLPMWPSSPMASSPVGPALIRDPAVANSSAAWGHVGNGAKTAEGGLRQRRMVRSASEEAGIAEGGGMTIQDDDDDTTHRHSLHFNLNLNLLCPSWSVCKAGRAMRPSKACLGFLVMVMVMVMVMVLWGRGRGEHSHVEGRGDAMGHHSFIGQVKGHLGDMHAPLQRRVDVEGASLHGEAQGPWEAALAFISSLGHPPQPKNHTHTTHKALPREAVSETPAYPDCVSLVHHEVSRGREA